MTGNHITTVNSGNAGRDVHAGGGNLRDQERRHRLLRGFQTAILLLSVGLIGFIAMTLSATCLCSRTGPT